MATNTNFALTNLDPDVAKQEFIAFLQTQPIFKDFNFKGSNINVILDILSRNTFLNAFYLNMAFTEAHIDSAQLRDSLVSSGKILNYIPSSFISSVAYVSVAVTSSSGNVFVIPAGTLFQGLNSNSNYTFTTDRDYVQISANNTFNFPNVAIYEGAYTSDVFVVDNSVENQLFTLSNPLIDITSLKVTLSEEKGSQNTALIQAEGIYDLSGNSMVYYLQGAEANCYSIQFGDGVLGYKPQTGAIATASYRLTFGADGNECGTFILSDNLSSLNNTSISNVTITTISNSAGGAQNESIESIRFRAPRMYQTQDRAVTQTDYKNLILRRFPQVGDVNVYGGNATATSVDYGSVFVAAVSPAGNPLPQTTKDAILGYIKPIAAIPVKDFIKIINANTIWLNVKTNVHIDFNQTNNTPDYYKTVVTNTIISFANNSLQKFTKSFQYSKLSTELDSIGSDNIVIGNETYFSMKRFVDVKRNSNNIIYFGFNNPISNITSTTFISNGYSCFVSDSYPGVSVAHGTLALITMASDNSLLSAATIGTVNYQTGLVSIPSLQISEYTSACSSFSFTAYTNSKVVYAINNDVFNIDPPTGITVNITNG